MSHKKKMREEKRKCRRCGKEFTVLVDEEGKIHSFDPYGNLCPECSYEEFINSEDWLEEDEEDWDSLDPEEKVQECIESGGGLCNDFECVEGGCPYWLGDGICELMLDEIDEEE